MNDAQRRRNRKWLILGLSGLTSGLLTMLVVRSVPMASGTAAAVVIGLIVVKHVGLLVAVASPLAALSQFARPRLLALCGKPPDGGD